jgi:hypothetical protein
MTQERLGKIFPILFGVKPRRKQPYFVKRGGRFLIGNLDFYRVSEPGERSAVCFDYVNNALADRVITASFNNFPDCKAEYIQPYQLRSACVCRKLSASRRTLPLITFVSG